MGHHTIHMAAYIEKPWVTQASTSITGKENVKVTLFTLLSMQSSKHPHIMWIQIISFCFLLFVFCVFKHVTFVNSNYQSNSFQISQFSYF